MLVYLQDNNLESLLEKAKEHEKKYEWHQATECYKKASDVVLTDNSKICAELFDKSGFCYFRAAFQAQSNDQFTKIMRLAIQSYEKAVVFFKKTNNEDMMIRVDDALANISYVKFWIETSFLQSLMK